MKKFIAGFIAGSLIFGSMGAYASGGNMIEVFYNIKDIKINKVSKAPSQQPFTYKGSTYVPLRYISEELGMPVKWDGATQTVHIGQMEEANAFYPGRDIEHMNYQTGLDVNKYQYKYGQASGIKDNVGISYANYVTLRIDGRANESKDTSWNLIEFPLNGQYDTFKAKLGLTESAKTTPASGTVEILLDGNVSKTYTINPGDMPEDISINVKSVNKITFKLIRHGEGRSWGPIFEIGLFDARFLK